MSGPTASRIAKDTGSSHAARDMAATESASHAAPPGPQGNIVALQHTAGNEAVSRLLGPGRAGASTDGPLLDRGSGQPLDPATRTAMESHLGQDLGQVRIHTGGRAARMASGFAARAFTMGSDVAFGAGEYQPQTPAGQHLLAHELAHTVQQSAAGGPAQAGAGEGALEAEANQVAGGAQITRPALRTGPRVQRQPAGRGGPAPAPDVQFAMIVSAPPVKAVKAREALEAFRKLSAPDRRKAFEANHPTGGIGNLLRGLSRDDAAGPYKDEVRLLLRWVEEAETQKASGQTDDQMAASQAAFQQAEAAKLAQAKLAAKAPVGGAPAAPTPADKEAARKEQVEQTSIPATVATTWDKMLKPTQEAWEKRAVAVITAVVAYATAHHPELKITADLFLADFPGVEKRGQGVLAFGQANAAGKTQAVFGFSFVEAAEANPAYVMSVVVHEVFGHPEYGPYGREYHLALYDKAQAKIPGYAQPAPGSADRTSEIDAYAYQETEIYSLLRSLPYHTPIAAKDAGKGLVSVDPKSTVEARIDLMKQQWKPGLAGAILRGLYVRLLLDPRISGLALDAFRAGVRAKFTAKEAKEILKQGP